MLCVRSGRCAVNDQTKRCPLCKRALLPIRNQITWNVVWRCYHRCEQLARFEARLRGEA